MKKVLFLGLYMCVAAIALTSCESEQNEPIQDSVSQLTSREILEANVPKEYMEIGNSMVDFVNEFMSDFSQNVKNPNCDDEVLAFAKERYQAYNSASKLLKKAPSSEEPYEFSEEELEILGKINKMVLMSDDMRLTAVQTQEIINDIKKLPIAKQDALNAYVVLIDETPTLVEEGVKHTTDWYVCIVSESLLISAQSAFAGGIVGGIWGGPWGFLAGAAWAAGAEIFFHDYANCDVHDNPQGATGCTIWIPTTAETNNNVLLPTFNQYSKIDLSDNKVWAEPNTTLAGREIKDSDFVNGTEEEIDVFKRRLESGNKLNKTRQLLLE